MDQTGHAAGSRPKVMGFGFLYNKGVKKNYVKALKRTLPVCGTTGKKNPGQDRALNPSSVVHYYTGMQLTPGF